MRGSVPPLSSSCVDAADQIPGRRIDAARKRPAAGKPVAALDLARPAARKDQRRADEIVGRSAPDLVLRLLWPHAEKPMMRREIGQHPAGRGIAAGDDRDQFDNRAERQLAAADPLRLKDAEEPGFVQIGDRLVGQPAQFLGARGAFAQCRDQRLGARFQVGEIRRRAAASALCLRHRRFLFPGLSSWPRQSTRGAAPERGSCCKVALRPSRLPLREAQLSRLRMRKVSDGIS